MVICNKNNHVVILESVTTVGRTLRVGCVDLTYPQPDRSRDERERRKSTPFHRLAGFQKRKTSKPERSVSLGYTRGDFPVTKLTANTIKKITNKIQAILVAAPATPVNPTTPAIKAMIKNVMAQFNMARILPCYKYPGISPALLARAGIFPRTS